MMHSLMYLFTFHYNVSTLIRCYRISFKLSQRQLAYVIFDFKAIKFSRIYQQILLCRSAWEELVTCNTLRFKASCYVQLRLI